MKKYKFLIMLSLMVVITALFLVVNPTQAKAATETGEFTEGDYTYTVSSGEVTITEYTGSDSNVTIPDELGGCPVTTIGEEAFWNCDSLISVAIPDGVTTIGSDAFMYCGSLTSITIPDSVTTIGDNAFRDCSSLTSVTIPDSVTTIGDYAFVSCTGLTSVTIPDSVTTIGDSAFEECICLISVTIPDSVTTIGDNAFIYCSSLTNIWVDENNPAYSSDDCGVLFNKDKTMLIKAPGQMSGEYVMPNSVVSIGEDAFYDCTNLSFNVYDNAKYLGSSSNPYYALICATSEDITICTINENTKVIANNAFEWCDSLISVTIPDSVTAIGDSAFSSSGLTSVAIPDSVTTIGDSAFMYCGSLTSITIPDSVTTIGDNAFRGCSSLTSVTIPDSVTTIGDSAFYSCDSLTGIWVDEDNLSYSSDDRGVLFNKNKTTLIQAPGALSGNYTIPDGVTTIGDNAFRGCSSLTSVTIPDSVTTIGDYAFASCTGLTSVTIPDSVTTIGDSAFSSSGLTSVAIPDSVTTIGDYAFSYCTGLTFVTIPDSVTTIGNFAFYWCYGLTAVTIPDSVTIIEDGAFGFCLSLTAVTIPDSVITIETAAFDYCINLTSVTIPDSVTAISDYAFSDCDNLTDVYYGGSAAQWDEITIGDNEELLEANIHFEEEHTHSYTKKVTEPTCTTEGYTTYTCECGDTYKENYVRALGHSYSNDCDTSCNRCKATRKITHSYAAATCTKPKTCKVCKATSGKALGHTYKSGSCTRCKHKPAGVKITTQPVNVAVSNGKTAKVTIKASGAGLKYTWYYAKKGAKSYTKTDVTASSYSVKMSNSINGGKVYCVVTDQYGNSVKSNVVTLYKGTAVKITTQPKSTTVANGKSGSLTIKASGSSLKYQWYIKYKGASAFTKIGKSSKTYSFKMASKLDGAQVYCVVKDKYGVEVKSSVVTLKMPTQPKITTQPKSTKAFSGKTVKFTVKASGDGLKYQWYYAKKGSTKFKKLSAKSATYSVKVSSSVDGRKYYCVVTDKYGQTVKTSTVTLTMQRAAKILTQPKNVSAKNGKAAKVTIKAEGDGLKYTWYYLLAGETKYRKAAFTGNTFSVTMVAKYKNTKVYCAISDQYGNTVKSKTVTLKMK